MNPQQPSQDTPPQPQQVPPNSGPQPGQPQPMPASTPPQPAYAQPQAPVYPAGAPIAPAQGMAPAGFAPAPQSPAPGGLGGLNKKMVVWIAAGVGALVVIVIAIVLVVSLTSVSKADYAKSYSVASEARSSYSKLGISLIVGTTGTNTERENDLDTLKKNRADFDGDFEEVGKTKAVQADGEAKKLYAAVQTKKQDFDGVIDGTIEVYEYVYPAVSSASSGVYASKNYEDAADKLLKEFKAINESKLTTSYNKELVQKAVPALEKLKKTAAAYDKSSSSYTKYNPDAYTNYAKARTAFTDILTDWQSDFKKAAEDAEIASEFNDLGKYLADKSSS